MPYMLAYLAPSNTLSHETPQAQQDAYVQMACASCGVGLVVSTCSNCVQPKWQVATFLQVCIAAYVQKAAALRCQSWCKLNGLIGRSHSFLLHMLVQVLLDGTDIRELPLGWLRQQMGLVAQEPVLFGSTIADNIRQGREGASQADIEAAAEAASAHGFITALPLAYDTRVRGNSLLVLCLFCLNNTPV